MLIARPLDAADIAELVATAALHPSTALTLLDHHLALYALAIAQVLLKEVDLVLVALALVRGKQTLPAELPLASLTVHGLLLAGHVQHPAFALFVRAESQVGVFQSLVEGHDLFGLVLGLLGQPNEEITG